MSRGPQSTPIVLTDAERAKRTDWARRPPAPNDWRSAPRSSWPRPRGAPAPLFAPNCASPFRPSASGATDSHTRGWTGWPTNRGPARRAPSPTRRSKSPSPAHSNPSPPTRPTGAPAHWPANWGCLNWLNQVERLFAQITTRRTVGFDPYKGFFHAGRHGKPSLALDLMEEFRPVIADSVVLTLINNETVTKGDFLTWRDACHLTEAGRKKFFAAYEQRKATVVTHPAYGYRMSYARMLEVQARVLAACVRGELPAYTGFTVR